MYVWCAGVYANFTTSEYANSVKLTKLYSSFYHGYLAGTLQTSLKYKTFNILRKEM